MGLLFLVCDRKEDGLDPASKIAELIEPSLYFNMDDKSAERFANAFVARMARLHQL